MDAYPTWTEAVWARRPSAAPAIVGKAARLWALLLLLGACGGVAEQPTAQPPSQPATATASSAAAAPSPTSTQSASAPTAPPAATPPPAPTAPPPKATGSPSTPISVELELARWPALGDEVEVRLTVRSIEPAPGTTATILVPDGVDVIAGTLAMKGDLAPNQPLVHTATLRFTTAAEVAITGRALYTLANGDIWGDQAVIYLTIAAPGAPPSLAPTPPPAVPSP